MRTLGTLFLSDDNKLGILDTREIVVTDVFEIDLVCATPLAQVSHHGGQSQRYTYENGEILKEPFYTSNGFKGFLRRVAFSDLVAHITGFKEYNPKAEETYLYTSGNGGDKKSIEQVNTWGDEQKVRNAAPILSVFGAGLGNIAGKAAINELIIPNIPDKFKEVKGKENGAIYKFSKFLGSNGETRTDSLKDEYLQNIIDGDDAIRVSQAIRAEAITAKQNKKDGIEGDAKQQNAQMIFDVEYIIAGTPLKTAINPVTSFDFTEIERGCLIATMISASQLQTGSFKRKGYGRLNWDVRLNGEKLFSATRDNEYHSYIKLEVTDKAKEYLRAYKTFLNENIKCEDDIKIEKILSK